MSRSRVILLVHPDDGVRGASRVVLRREGFTVYEAANAIDALEQTREASPDLIITAMDFPRESGAKLIRTLRSEPIDAALRILALGHESMRAEATQAGADAFTELPFSGDQLIRAVTALIGRA